MGSAPHLGDAVWSPGMQWFCGRVLGHKDRNHSDGKVWYAYCLRCGYLFGNPWGAPLGTKELERLQRLRNRAYHLQNKIDAKPINYEMGYSKGELSALCWAVERITGEKFAPSSGRDHPADIASLPK